jgi:ABC-2 type transport system ATP-binding protein
VHRTIVAERLTKVYTTRARPGWLRTRREEKVAVHELSLRIPAGSVTGLLGLNGAGKTTTIKMLCTLLLPTAGRAEMDGLDLVRDAAIIRRRINMIAGGERMVYLRLTGRENLWYFGQLYDVERRALRGRIAELLAMVGLEEAADLPVERYSKGMKQRLQIARGLINDPDYLFLDEPTLGLDAPIARQLRAIVRELAARGKGLLLTSHYLAEVEELCGHIYVIERGQLMAQGSPDELKQLTGRERIVRVLVAALPEPAALALASLSAQTGARVERHTHDDGVLVEVRHPSDLAGPIAAALATHGASLLTLEVVEPTLEDAVLALAEHSRTEELPAYVAR